MAESRNNGESREATKQQSFNVCVGESMSCTEIVGAKNLELTKPQSLNICSAESMSCTGTVGTKNSGSNNKYNSLESIDELIAKMEKETPKIIVSTDKVNKALKEREEKIKLLKQLRDQIDKEEKEEELLGVLKKSNSELDDAIRDIKKLVKTPIKQTKQSVDFYDCSESHDSGESRW